LSSFRACGLVQESAYVVRFASHVASLQLSPGFISNSFSNFLFHRPLFTIDTSFSAPKQGEAPLENISPPMEKCIGHNVKLLDTFQKICAPQKTLRPSWSHKLVTGLPPSLKQTQGSKFKESIK